jgi:hypothetical protein
MQINLNVQRSFEVYIEKKTIIYIWELITLIPTHAC